MSGSLTPLVATVLIAAGSTVLGASEVRVWGDATQAQPEVFAVPAGLNHAIAVSASFNHVLALLDTGGVVAWGDNSKGQCNVPSAASSHVIAIDNEVHISFALKNDGTLIGWGSNIDHALDIPNDLPPVRSVHVQTGAVIVVLFDNSIRMWGDFAYQPPAGLLVKDAYPFVINGGVAIKADGTIFQWLRPGIIGYQPVPPGLIATSLTENRQSSIAISSGGIVTQWGLNTYNSANLPSGLSGVIEATSGGSFSLARKSDSSLVVWGAEANVPGIAPPPTWNNAIALSASTSYSVGVFAIGSSPTTVSLSSHLIPIENVIGTRIGDFSATDPDSGATFTFEFIDGTGATDNDLFTISGTHLTTSARIIPDNTTRSIRILARDENGNSKAATFQLTVAQNDSDNSSKKCGLGGASIFLTALMCCAFLRRRSVSLS